MEVEVGKLSTMPPIPSPDSTRVQFVPNNAVSATAEKMTDRIGIIRKIQQRAQGATNIGAWMFLFFERIKK